MADMGVGDLGKDRIIRQAYDAVGIITFFTAGEPEVRGWNLERVGATASCGSRQDPPTWPKGSSVPKSLPTKTFTRRARSRKPRPSICNGSKGRNT